MSLKQLVDIKRILKSTYKLDPKTGKALEVILDNNTEILHAARNLEELMDMVDHFKAIDYWHQIKHHMIKNNVITHNRNKANSEN